VKNPSAKFTCLPPVGGAAEIACKQACGFTVRGHEVTVATSFNCNRAPEQTPRAISRLLDGGPRRKALGRQGRAEAEMKYSRERVPNECERLCRELTKG